MDDTISRQEAINTSLGFFVEFLGGAFHENAQKELIARFQNLPPAQPEIVRCKDCENWDTTWQNDYAPNYHYCPLVDGTRRDDFYCADAERRGKQDG